MPKPEGGATNRPWLLERPGARAGPCATWSAFEDGGWRLRGGRMGGLEDEGRTTGERSKIWTTCEEPGVDSHNPDLYVAVCGCPPPLKPLFSTVSHISNFTLRCSLCALAGTQPARHPGRRGGSHDGVGRLTEFSVNRPRPPRLTGRPRSDRLTEIFPPRPIFVQKHEFCVLFSFFLYHCTDYFVFFDLIT